MHLLNHVIPRQRAGAFASHSPRILTLSRVEAAGLSIRDSTDGDGGLVNNPIHCGCRPFNPLTTAHWPRDTRLGTLVSVAAVTAVTVATASSRARPVRAAFRSALARRGAGRALAAAAAAPPPQPRPPMLTLSLQPPGPAGTPPLVASSRRSARPRSHWRGALPSTARTVLSPEARRGGRAAGVGGRGRRAGSRRGVHAVH